MAVSYGQNSDKKCKLHVCGLGQRKRCPEPVSSKEPPIAEELRSIMSGNIFINDNREAFTFINQLTAYPMDPCMSCEAYTKGYFHLINYDELVTNTEWLKVNGQYLYPMLVWVNKNNKPILVMVSPGQNKPIKIIKKHSSDCLAYMICVTKQI
ncbi:MAG TPA: hypothetical protein VJZ06_01465 [Mobilitalea sp.]|nr:hypothetical protein [Mobilitalea sp.]